MNPTIDECSAPIMPRVEELPYHGDNPNSVRRFRLEGGDLAPGWLRDGRTAWCELSVFPEGTVGSYGGEVWPMAWPDLFAAIPPSAAYGSAGVRLTPLGFKLLGMHVTVTPCGPPPARPSWAANRKRWMVRLDGKTFGFVNEVLPDLYDVDLAHAVWLFPSLEKATERILEYVEEMEQTQQRAELSAATDSIGHVVTARGRQLDVDDAPTLSAELPAAERYAALATVASARGNHDLAADMYMLAAEHAIGRDAIGHYIEAANVERTAARGSSTAVRS